MLLKHIYLVLKIFCTEKQVKMQIKLFFFCNAKRSASKSDCNYVFNHHIHVCFVVGIELRGGGHASRRRRDVLQHLRAARDVWLPNSRPVSFHSNCIQSQPLFLLINTAVSSNLRPRTRIHLDGCISWGDPGGSRDVTDEERWWGNSCWSDSPDFSLNSAITPKRAQIIIPSSSFSPITPIASPEKGPDVILSACELRFVIEFTGGLLGVLVLLAYALAQISLVCWRVSYWNWKLRHNDFCFWNKFVSAVDRDLLLAHFSFRFCNSERH